VVATVEAVVEQKGQVLVAFDFDCTLSGKHMFKAMYQPTSHWASSWDWYARENQAQAADRDTMDIAEKLGSPTGNQPGGRF